MFEAYPWTKVTISMVESCQVMDNAGRLVEAPKNISGSFTMQVIHLACEHPMKFMTEIWVCLKRGNICVSQNLMFPIIMIIFMKFMIIFMTFEYMRVSK